MSQLRQIRRLSEQLAGCKDEVEALKGQLIAKEVELVKKTGEWNHALEDIAGFKGDIAYERLQRVSAQRGLVDYMREHGLADRIGYDPDQDAVVKEDIAAGRIPPRNDPRVIKALAATIVAERVLS